MKKRVKLILMALVGAIVFGCAGCSDGQLVAKGYTAPPNMTIYTNNGGAFYYAVDNSTNVVYVVLDIYNKGGITVMLNPDGTPVLADQIGLK